MPSDSNNNSQEQQQFQQSLEIVDSLNITKGINFAFQIIFKCHFKVMKDTMSLFWVKACRYQKEIMVLILSIKLIIKTVVRTI